VLLMKAFKQASPAQKIYKQTPGLRPVRLLITL